MDEEALARNIQWVQGRIAEAADRAGRRPDDVALVAVSKTRGADVVAQAYALGLRCFGENRVEEGGPKAAEVSALVAPAPPPSWHLVGHLQSRKAAAVLPWVTMVQAVDSIKLAGRLSREVESKESGRRLPILLEVNVSGEASKFGFDPCATPQAVESIAQLRGLVIEGLMTMAPVVDDPQWTRPVFAALRCLRDELAERFPALSWRHLSMGMTDDFEVAIEEGATLVRIGRALFGERQV